MKTTLTAPFNSSCVEDLAFTLYAKECSEKEASIYSLENPDENENDFDLLEDEQGLDIM